MVYSIQYLRAVAALLIVMTHSSTLLESPQGVYLWPNFTEINIAFTFAAGFLFHRLSINEPFSSFFSRRLKNVLLPYLVISIPALAIYVIGNKAHPFVDLTGMSALGKALYLISTGLHLAPLWFIPMIFTIYVMTPAIKFLDLERRYYFIALLVTLSAAVLIFERPSDNENPLIAAAHFLPVFIFGMLCSREELFIRIMSFRFWRIALLAFIATFMLSTTQPDDYQFILKIFMLAFIFVVATRFDAYRFRVIDVGASLSFGIFFIHGYVVSLARIILEKTGLSIAANHLTLIIVTAGVLATTVGIIYSVKYALGRKSKLVIGT